MSVRRARAAVVLIPLAVPLALAGCGSGNSAGTPSSAASSSSSSAAAKTAFALCEKPGDIDKGAFFAAKSESPDKTAHLDGTIEVDAMSSGAGTATSGAGTGAGGGISLSGDVDGTDAKNPKVRMTMGAPGGGGQMEMLLIDKTMYLKMGAQTGNKYVQVSQADLAKQAGVDFDQLTDPRAQMEKAKDTITKITCVGREDVAGKQTAHLRLTMDTAKMSELATPSATSTSGTRSPSAGASMPATLDTDLWIDADNRPLKVASGMPSAKMTMTYSKWGEPVTIQAPPTASVTTLPGLGGAGKATASPAPATS